MVAQGVGNLVSSLLHGIPVGGPLGQTGAGSQVAIVATVTATLLLPVAAAAGIGVALSLVLQLNRKWLRGTGRVGEQARVAGATPVLGESTYAAYLSEATWLTEGGAQRSEDGDRVDRRAGPHREP